MSESLANSQPCKYVYIIFTTALLQISLTDCTLLNTVWNWVRLEFVYFQIIRIRFCNTTSTGTVFKNAFSGKFYL